MIHVILSRGLDFLGKKSLKVAVIDLSPEHNEEALFDPLKALKSEISEVEVHAEKVSDMTSYYRKIRFHIHAHSDSEREVELVNGGDTDWTQKLLSNAKERLFISGIGSEKLCEQFSCGSI